MKKMRFCTVCKNYTISLFHCSKNTVSAHPVKFNPKDRHGGYRRKIKYGV